MNDAIRQMLSRYNTSTTDGYKNALKEIIQEIALLGLSRAKFFEYAAFYGGTALRIFYQNDRFSEDLDFSLLKPNSEFDISPYCKFIRDELTSYGFNTKVEKKAKVKTGKIESAFIKANTLQHLIKIESIKNAKSGTHSNELLKVKFEVDTDPPDGADYEARFCSQPIPFSVKMYDTPSLLAGKIHAFLFRNYGSGRIKGRDLYDFIRLAFQKSPLNLYHLEMRMRQTGDWNKTSGLTPAVLRTLINNHANRINLEEARKDVYPFIERPESMNAWSPELIMHAYDSIQILEL
ncbi:MAG: nucleotidyl transferase AbiEii/AbiGii toxin family protein [Fibrobacteria bacterium]|nr:nucleotidyl transferase AbiEii/AbiGii toxin family protein [Fibrobacteria bacterium]